MKTLALMLTAGLLGLMTNARATWYEIPSGTTKKLNTINFPSSNIGYIGGNDSLLLKTTDGGETWNPVTYSGVTFYPGGEHILNLKFVSETVGYMTVGPYSGTYKTTDGGSTWSQVITSGNLCFNEGLYFFDEQNGFIAGSGCFQGELIDRMTAGVIAPTTINFSTNTAENRITDMDFYTINYGLAVSRSGYVLRTTDGGSNWDTIPTNLGPDIPLTSVLLINDTLAFAGYNDPGGGFGILMTTDAGLTWNMDMGSATFFYPAFLSLHKSGNGTVYSGAQPSFGNTGLIFEWTYLTGWNFSEVDQPINDLGSYSDSVVFGVGDSGYVVVNQPPGTLSFEKPVSPEFTFEVYPNPAADQIFIRTHSDHSNSRIIITSLSGEIVYQDFFTGSPLSVESLTSGIYLIQLVSETNTSTRTFIRY